MPARQVETFCSAVRNCARRGDSDALVQSLSAAPLKPVDACLVGAAVAITRELPLPRGAFLLKDASNEWREGVIDALSVTFMFNVVNRIANAYNLEPEWDTALAGVVSRTRIQRLMAIGLPLLMSLANDSTEDFAEAPQLPLALESLIQEYGVARTSTLWRHFFIFPTVGLAIYRLLWASLRYCETEPRIIDAVVDACLNSVAKDDGLSTSARAQSIEAPYWQELFNSPHALTSLNTSDPTQGNSDAKVDMVFRIALQAAVQKLNEQRVLQLLYST